MGLHNIEVPNKAQKGILKEVQFVNARFPEGFELQSDSLSYTRVL